MASTQQTNFFSPQRARKRASKKKRDPHGARFQVRPSRPNTALDLNGEKFSIHAHGSNPGRSACDGTNTPIRWPRWRKQHSTNQSPPECDGTYGPHGRERESALACSTHSARLYWWACQCLQLASRHELAPFCCLCSESFAFLRQRTKTNCQKCSFLSNTPNCFNSFWWKF